MPRSVVDILTDGQWGSEDVQNALVFRRDGSGKHVYSGETFQWRFFFNELGVGKKIEGIDGGLHKVRWVIDIVFDEQDPIKMHVCDRALLFDKPPFGKMSLGWEKI